MLEIQNLNASYGQAQVLFNVSFVVSRGNMLLIRGLNGAGKSSLLSQFLTHACTLKPVEPNSNRYKTPRKPE